MFWGYHHFDFPGYTEVVYIPGTWRCPLFWRLFPPKQGRNSNQNKGPHLGSRYIYIYKSQVLFDLSFGWGCGCFWITKIGTTGQMNLMNGIHKHTQIAVFWNDGYRDSNSKTLQASMSRLELTHWLILTIDPKFPAVFHPGIFHESGQLRHCSAVGQDLPYRCFPNYPGWKTTRGWRWVASKKWRSAMGPIPSMGRLYVYPHGWWMAMVHVGKYIIHEFYGL